MAKASKISNLQMMGRTLRSSTGTAGTLDFLSVHTTSTNVQAPEDDFRTVQCGDIIRITSHEPFASSQPWYALVVQTVGRYDTVKNLPRHYTTLFVRRTWPDGRLQQDPSISRDFSLDGQHLTRTTVEKIGRLTLEQMLTYPHDQIRLYAQQAVLQSK